MLAEFRQFIATLIRKTKRTTDYHRWRQVSRLDADWSQRLTVVASLIAPDSRVLEFGAGRQILRTLLPSTCTYVPSDLVSRSEDTFICDLNAALLPKFPEHDTAVFSGVLEYVHDVPRIVECLKDTTATIVASYAPCNQRGFSVRFRRLTNGWVNNFSKYEFEQLFKTHGWRQDAETKWNGQYIWRFRK